MAKEKKEKDHTYTILEDGEMVREMKGYTLLVASILNPKDSDFQAIVPAAFGRNSVGDHLSMIVATIQTAVNAMKVADVPQKAMKKMLETAIIEGIESTIYGPPMPKKEEKQ